jgi:hypothetical protein
MALHRNDRHGAERDRAPLRLPSKKKRRKRLRLQSPPRPARVARYSRSRSGKTGFGGGFIRSLPISASSPPCFSCRRFRNGRDDMARKRSKRASRTSAVRGKRRGRARATPTQRRAQPKGMINAWEDDPGAGAQSSAAARTSVSAPTLVVRSHPLTL